MADDIVVNQNSSMGKDQTVQDIVTRLLSLNHPDAADAADEIERLRAALAFAVGELSTHDEYTAWTPEMLMNQFLDEVRRV